jgi:hypothetical protein
MLVLPLLTSVSVYRPERSFAGERWQNLRLR